MVAGPFSSVAFSFGAVKFHIDYYTCMSVCFRALYYLTMAALNAEVPCSVLIYHNYAWIMPWEANCITFVRHGIAWPCTQLVGLYYSYSGNIHAQKRISTHMHTTHLYTAACSNDVITTCQGQITKLCCCRLMSSQLITSLLHTQ